ncbi:unnamed protein product [Cuscuta europaea]|uniref:Uncharacterized protein n=1 Tax=Cuscuta europaea TaxID=41803 RepID=A0A9P0ZDM6_CUSEU|nr:unnamed protein product [Cuscuta europaea]
MADPYSSSPVKTLPSALHMQSESLVDEGKPTSVVDLKSKIDLPIDPVHASPTRPFIFRRVHFGYSSEGETDLNLAIRKKYGDNLVSDTYDGLEGLKDGEEVTSAGADAGGYQTCSDDSLDERDEAEEEARLELKGK